MDLDRNRQVTSELARLSLRNWFPSSTPSPPPSSHDNSVKKDADDRGLSKGVELFEVSAKDYTGQTFRLTLFSKTQCILGIHSLFEHLVSAIVGRKDIIKRENELKKGDGEPPERSGAWSKLLGIFGMDRPTHS